MVMTEMVVVMVTDGGDDSDRDDRCYDGMVVVMMEVTVIIILKKRENTNLLHSRFCKHRGNVMSRVQSLVRLLAIVALWQGAVFRRLTAVNTQGALGCPSGHLAVAGLQTVVRVQGSGTSSLRKEHGETWAEGQSPSQAGTG